MQVLATHILLRALLAIQSFVSKLVYFNLSSPVLSYSDGSPFWKHFLGISLDLASSIS